jgi:hypothetical protein
LDVLGSISGAARSFSTPQRPNRLWGPPSLLHNGNLGLFSRRIKWLELEADHSPPSNAEVENCGATIPLLHMSSWDGA